MVTDQTTKQKDYEEHCVGFVCMIADWKYSFPMGPHVSLLLCSSVGRSVNHNFLTRQLHFHPQIETLFLFYYQDVNCVGSDKGFLRNVCSALKYAFCSDTVTTPA